LDEQLQAKKNVQLKPWQVNIGQLLLSSDRNRCVDNLQIHPSGRKKNHKCTFKGDICILHSIPMFSVS
jgi:hypothetical protein